MALVDATTNVCVAEGGDGYPMLTLATRVGDDVASLALTFRYTGGVTSSDWARST